MGVIKKSGITYAGGGGGGGGSDNYNELSNKPKINSVELASNKTGGDLGLQDKMAEITNSEIDTIVFG